MKLQDAVFLIMLAFLLRKREWLLWAGLACFALAIPLFSRWIFFTAERLTWYGAAFIAAWVLIQLRK